MMNPKKNYECVRNGWIERMKEYKLFGTWMNEDGSYSTEMQIAEDEKEVTTNGTHLQTNR